ncbi:uncharacterized protein LOC129316582 [Prosopis cineraria]|uniref:uncharacterized protein LOC129316582 n=1 Tax=Prosopis cineraria TaxID=364024 RepID=UPI00240FEADB|nr:uncharacterized protein LOC129316582 [Prosopis cineraria]
MILHDKEISNLLLGSGEEPPHRTCKNKNYVGKVMFLVTVARPRFDAQGNEIFSGKIGLFPFVRKKAVRRRSVNRNRRIMETKPITSITKEVMKSFLIDKVLPKIKAKWPTCHTNETIFVQQDNAPSHIDNNDEDFQMAASDCGFDIHLVSQPPNFLDLNILDLGYFKAIQALQYQEAPKTIEDLVRAVENSFEVYTSKQLNRIFLTLQATMVDIMKDKGSNKYKPSHLKKDVIERRGELPNQLKCDPYLVQEVLEHLEEVDG